MVQKVTGFKTLDGQYFETEVEALSHEKRLSLGEAVKAALVKLGYDGVEFRTEVLNDTLESFLLDNSEALVEALTPPKKERKPRAPKEPVEPNKTLTEALSTVATSPVVTPGALEEAHTTLAVEPEPVNTEAGAAAEDELAQLLGGEASATTSTEVAV